MQASLTAIQIIIAVALIGVVILQQRGDHKGGNSFGAVGATYRSKKGIEQFLFYATIFLAAMFASISILAVVI